uniref:Aldo/keto reductase n=1 Tax=uncultured bacterium Contig783 TaxID=1393612 RepID=W0FP07_9BACT|nr:aldo/keto reductase [uncultured bacterium Contig783]
MISASTKRVGTLGFSPLCQGILTGKYRNGIPEDSRIAKKDLLKYDKTANFYMQNKERIDRYFEVCDSYGVDPLSVAIRWCLRKEVYPVMGASSPAQLEKNVAALSAELPDEIWDELEKI